MSNSECINDELLQQNIKEDIIPCLANNETKFTSVYKAHGRAKSIKHSSLW